MPIRKAQWNTDTQFNYGSPTLTNVEVINIGEDAYISLSKNPILYSNINFNSTSGYIYNPSEIEFFNGKAEIEALSSTENYWTFTSGSLYTYSGSLITVSDGKASLANVSTSYAQWHLNETSGSIAYDSSGNNRNGTLVNSPIWTMGKLNNCLRFSNAGSAQYINCGNIANFERTDSFSIELWFRTSSTGVTLLITKMVLTPTMSGWEFFLNGGIPYFYLMHSYSPVNYICLSCSGTYYNNVWHHAVITYDGSSTAAGLKMYINGTQPTRNVIQDNLSGSITTSVNLYIANRSELTSYKYDGYIDEVVIYNKVLSQADVTYRYNLGTGREGLPLLYSTLNPTIIPKVGFSFSSELREFEVVETIPENTEIKYNISKDNGSTWLFFVGGSWNTSNGAYEETNTKTEVDSNIENLGTSGILSFKAFLHSDDGISSPELDTIEVATSTTYPTGNFIIEMNYDIIPEEIVYWLSFTETVTKPDNTNILYQYSVDSGITYNNTWLTASQIQTALLAIINPDKLRIKIQLSTTDNTATPSIDNILITSDGSYVTSGLYESYAYQPENNTNGVYLQSIDYTVNIPTGTTLKIEVRNIDHALEQGYIEYNNGDSIELCGDLLQWRATFTGNGLITPTISNVEISFHTLIGIMQSIDTQLTTVLSDTNIIKNDLNVTSGQLAGLLSDTETILTGISDIKGTGFIKDDDSLVNLSHGAGGLSAQEVRDAMLLSPGSGTIGTNSIDNKLDLLRRPKSDFDNY